MILTIGGLLAISPGLALAQTVIYEETFDDGASDWYPDNGIWQVGYSTVGPVSGSNVAGTVLDGNYPYQADSRFIGPWITLPASPQGGGLWLRFSQWFNLHTVDGTDYGQVLIALDSAPNDWIPLTGNMTAWSPYWTQHMADLIAYANETVRFAFRIRDQDGNGGGHNESHGWYLDYISVLEGRFPDRSLHTFDDSNNPYDWEGWYAENGCWKIGELAWVPHSGRRCAATNLSGPYSYQANSRLISPPFSLPSSPRDGELWLSFWSWSNMHYADGTDYGQVEIQVEGGGWEILPFSVRYWAGCWSPCVIDLSDYIGQDVRLAFHMVDVDGNGGGHNESGGWEIDDVAIREGKRWLNNIEDCEGTITGWASTEGLWQMGVPTSGPGTAASGAQCWATRLDGNYGLYSRSSLVSTSIDLPATPPVQFSFKHWFSFSTADGMDTGYLYVKHAGGDSLIESFTATSGGVWTPYLVDLSAFAGQAVRIEFRIFDTDGNGGGHYESSGWYLDDFAFNGLEASSPPSPVLTGVAWSTGAPVVNFYADPAALDQVCVYASKNRDDIVNLSNRVAVLPASGIGSFTDLERPGWGRYFYSVTGVDALGHESVFSGPWISAVDDDFGVPARAQVDLHGSHPNPFNPKTEISFTVTQAAHVVLEIYDLRGRLVGRLLDEPVPAGRHTVPFENRRLASGVYMARVQVGNEFRTCKMMLTK